MLTVLLSLLLADSVAPRRIAVHGADTITVTRMGSGPPVVFVNGLIGGAFGFRRIMPEVAALGMEAIAVEPLGMGESARPSRADYSLTAQADRVAEALDSVGVRQVVLVAHSLGASIAFRLAYRRPDLVRGIVTIDGGPAESAATPGLRRAMRWAPLLKLFVSRGRLRKEVLNGLRENSGDTLWLTPDVLDGYTAPSAMNIGRTIDALRGMARSQEPERLRDHLRDIGVPVHLLVGKVPHESAILPAETELLQALLPRFTVDSIEGSGQLIHEEQPALVVRAIARMDEVTREPPTAP